MLGEADSVAWRRATMVNSVANSMDDKRSKIVLPGRRGIGEDSYRAGAGGTCLASRTSICAYKRAALLSAERVHPVASAVAFQAGPGRVTALATKERRRDGRRDQCFRGKSSLLLPAIEALVLLAGRRRP